MNDVYKQLVFEIDQSIEISAPPERVFRGLVKRLTDMSTGEGNAPMPMKLEEWPGGRWFRDLGNNTGHLWAHVQSIKPPTLLELSGPMCFSFAVATNMIIRLAHTDTGTRITLRHQILGPVPDDHRMGMNEGWGEILAIIKADLETA